jgi:curli biogenesis system outer membrane secretion channel CsgG
MSRNFLRVLVLGLVVLGCVPATAHTAVASAAVQKAEQSKSDVENETVYVARTGAKYHRDGCRYLRSSRIPMKLKDAAKNYTPCSVCRPPVLRGKGQ